MPTIFQTLDSHGQPHRNWRFKYIDYLGKRKTATGLPTKEATKKLANKIQTEQDEIRKGLRPPPTPAEKPRLFREVADEYLAWGAAQGGHRGRPWASTHYRMRKRFLVFWERNLELEWLADLVGGLARVEKVLRDFQNETSRQTKKKRAGKTIQNCAETIAAFCDWCVEREYLKDDPLKRLQKFNCDPTWFRRAITLEEAKAILAVAPPYRRLIYMIAMITGLRAGELRKLVVTDFRDGIVLRPEVTKNRREGFAPLYEMVITELNEAIRTKQPNESLLKVPKNTAKMLYRDMKKCGIPVWNDEGKLDFHALRTSFATFVVETGANAKETQTLLRHSTPDLTMKLYARARKNPLQGVITEVGQRLLGPCTTGVQQAAPALSEPSGSADSNGSSENQSGERFAGSNPSAASTCDTAKPGQPDAEVGLGHTQVGHGADVGHSPLVETRTAPDTAADGFGQRGCPTGVQRILAASGVFGFSIDTAAIPKNFSGFSGASMRSA